MRLKSFAPAAPRYRYSPTLNNKGLRAHCLRSDCGDEGKGTTTSKGFLEDVFQNVFLLVQSKYCVCLDLRQAGSSRGPGPPIGPALFTTYPSWIFFQNRNAMKWYVGSRHR